MRSVTNLTDSQNTALWSEKSIQLFPEGGFSLGCLNSTSIETFARAIDSVVRKSMVEAAKTAKINVAKAEAERLERVAQAERIEVPITAPKPVPTAPTPRELQEEAEAVLSNEVLINAIVSQVGDHESDQEDDESGRALEVEEQRSLEEEVRKAAEKAEMARNVADILASIV